MHRPSLSNDNAAERADAPIGGREPRGRGERGKRVIGRERDLPYVRRCNGRVGMKDPHGQAHRVAERWGGVRRSDCKVKVRQGRRRGGRVQEEKADDGYGRDNHDGHDHEGNNFSPPAST